MKTIFILRITFHLTPIIPLLNNYYIGSLICILLVLMPYIKTRKLENLYLQTKIKNKPEAEKIKRTIKFWKFFTFLNNQPG